LPLGLTGHAINLPNGDVEVLAFGNAAAIDKLAAWLQIGPPLSKVRDVMSEERPFEPRDDFVTG
jgi:acylphosphatase